MRKWRRVVAVAAVGFGMLGLVALQAQQAKTWSLGTLTPMDYIEIQQLVARYPYALDRGTDHGKVYAALFTADGVFNDQNNRTFRGPAELAKVADKGDDAPHNVGHFMMNHLIEPAAGGGATGKQYLLTFVSVGEEKNFRRASAANAYHYEDVYQKTPDGWKFKSRTVIKRSSAPTAAPAPAR